MTTYQITCHLTGVSLGTHEGACPEQAIDAMHRDAGHVGTEGAAEALGSTVEALRAELTVTPAEEARYMTDDDTATRPCTQGECPICLADDREADAEDRRASAERQQPRHRKPNIGRPMLGDAPLDRLVQTRVTSADGEALDAWAQRKGRPLAVLIRETLLRAARRGPR